MTMLDLQNATILAVDDTPDNLVSLRAVCRAFMSGVTLETAASGEEGLEKAANFQPDVILLDIQMPVMDGYETCRRLKANETTASIPVVFLTAHRTESVDKIKALEIGGDAFLAKPIDAGELGAQIKAMIRIKRSEDALRAEGAKLEEKVRERTEDLRKAEEFNRRIIESSSDCIKVLELDGRLSYMSKGGQEKLEIDDIQPYLGTQWIDFWKGEYHVAAASAVSAAARGEIGAFRGYCPTAKGRPKWWDVITTPINDDGGKPGRLLAISRDITERKKIEKELADHREHLEELVEKKTSDLRKMVNLMAGREIRMAELKKVIKKLREQIKEAGMAPIADDPLAGDE